MMAPNREPDQQAYPDLPIETEHHEQRNGNAHQKSEWDPGRQARVGLRFRACKEPTLLMSNKVVVDVCAQCANVGELHQAIVAGLSESLVYAELGEIVSGLKPGRTSEKEIASGNETL